MPVDLQQCLSRQLDISWGLLSLHLSGLDDDELLWRPAAVGLHVHRRPDGDWVADWPDREDYDIGPASIAWTTWHIGFWWSMAIDHSFGPATLDRASVHWPGAAEAVVRWLTSCHDDWCARLADLDDRALQATDRSRWPVRDRPFADVVAWVNVELMKNAAEIGALRFLHAARTEPR